MQVSDAIRQRRAVRDFKSEAVPSATLEKLIEAAAWAPSAMNSQPWLFTIIEGQELLDRISREARLHSLKTPNLSNRLKHILGDEEFQMFYNAPALIVISSLDAGGWATEDCTLAAANLMLAATDLGLGTCWIGFAQRWLQTDDGKRLLKLPPGAVPVAPIIVGYPSKPTPEVSRKAPKLQWLDRDLVPGRA